MNLKEALQKRLSVSFPNATYEEKADLSKAFILGAAEVFKMVVENRKKPGRDFSDDLILLGAELTNELPPKIDLLANLDKPKPEVHTTMPEGYTLLIDQDGHYGYKFCGGPVINGISSPLQRPWTRQEAIDGAWSYHNYFKSKPENRTWRKAE